MVDMEITHQGRLHRFVIEYGEIISGDRAFAAQVEQAKQEYISPAYGDPDYVIATRLLEDFDGVIVKWEHQPAPDGAVF